MGKVLFKKTSTENVAECHMEYISKKITKMVFNFIIISFCVKHTLKNEYQHNEVVNLI